MQTLRDIAPYLALAAVGLALVLLVLVLVLWRSVRRQRRAQVVVMGHHGERDLVAHAESLDSQVRNVRDAVEILTDELDDQKRQLDHALTNRAIVRYDAFRDAGGEQSASFALLDQYRSGVVISAIAARDFARIYVKHLDEGVADRDLSPEEEQAVSAAVPRPLAPGEEGQRARRAPLPPPALRTAAPRPPEAAEFGDGETSAAGGPPPVAQAVGETGPTTEAAPPGADAAPDAGAAPAVVEAALDDEAGEPAPPSTLPTLLEDDAFAWEDLRSPRPGRDETVSSADAEEPAAAAAEEPPEPPPADAGEDAAPPA